MTHHGVSELTLTLAPDVGEQLVNAARNVARCSYSPYSKFRVGAAVLGDDGKIYSGCNVENSSYGLAICAERVAIFGAISAGCRRVEAIAVTCLDADGNLPSNFRMPCGACRQVMAEFADPSLTVLVDGARKFTLDEILPHPFKL